MLVNVVGVGELSLHVLHNSGQDALTASATSSGTVPCGGGLHIGNDNNLHGAGSKLPLQVRSAVVVRVVVVVEARHVLHLAGHDIRNLPPIVPC